MPPPPPPPLWTVEVWRQDPSQTLNPEPKVLIGVSLLAFSLAALEDVFIYKGMGVWATFTGNYLGGPG